MRSTRCRYGRKKSKRRGCKKKPGRKRRRKPTRIQTPSSVPIHFITKAEVDASNRRVEKLQRDHRKLIVKLRHDEDKISKLQLRDVSNPKVAKQIFHVRQKQANTLDKLATLSTFLTKSAVGYGIRTTLMDMADVPGAVAGTLAGYVTSRYM